MFASLPVDDVVKAPSVQPPPNVPVAEVQGIGTADATKISRACDIPATAIAATLDAVEKKGSAVKEAVLKQSQLYDDAATAVKKVITSATADDAQEASAKIVEAEKNIAQTKSAAAEVDGMVIDAEQLMQPQDTLRNMKQIQKECEAFKQTILLNKLQQFETSEPHSCIGIGIIDKQSKLGAIRCKPLPSGACPTSYDGANCELVSLSVGNISYGPMPQ